MVAEQVKNKATTPAFLAHGDEPVEAGMTRLMIQGMNEMGEIGEVDERENRDEEAVPSPHPPLPPHQPHSNCSSPRNPPCRPLQTHPP